MLRQLLAFTVSVLVSLAVAGSESQQQCEAPGPKQSSRMVLSQASFVFRCNSGGHDGHDEQEHTKFPLNFNTLSGKFVDISSRGREIWAVDKNQSIYRFVNGQWKKIPGAAVQIAATADGWAWHVNKKDEIYRYNLDKQAWDRMPGALVQVSALSKDVAIGVNRQKELLFWKNNQWKKYENTSDSLPNGAVWASIGKKGEAWAVGPFGYLWRMDPKDQKFKMQDPKEQKAKIKTEAAVNVDVVGPDRVLAVTKENYLLQWDSNSKSWKKLAEKSAKRISVGDHVVLTLDTGGVLSAHGL